MATKFPVAQVYSWCHEHSWTDPFWQEGCFWAFPPNAVMPLPIPINLCGSQLPLPDEDVPQLRLSTEPDSKSGLLKWGQKQLDNTSAWILFTLGILLLAVSDPQFPGSLVGLPPITQGYPNAQLLVFAVFVYQACLWCRAISRGKELSAELRCEKALFTLKFLTLLEIIQALGGSFPH